MFSWIPTHSSTAAAAVVGYLLVTVAAAWLARWLYKPRSSHTRDGVRIEAHGTHMVDDLILERLWRTTISVTNVSRGPRPVPLFASRATVRAGRKVYLAGVFVERDLCELNPDEVVVVQVDCLLAAGVAPQTLELIELRPAVDSKRLQLRPGRQHMGVGIPAS